MGTDKFEWSLEQQKAQTRKDFQALHPAGLIKRICPDCRSSYYNECTDCVLSESLQTLIQLNAATNVLLEKLLAEQRADFKRHHQPEIVVAPPPPVDISPIMSTDKVTEAP